MNAVAGLRPLIVTSVIVAGFFTHPIGMVLHMRKHGRRQDLPSPADEREQKHRIHSPSCEDDQANLEDRQTDSTSIPGSTCTSSLNGAPLPRCRKVEIDQARQRARAESTVAERSCLSSPGFGAADAVKGKLRLRIERLRHGKPAKSMVLVGVGGVGKTALLDEIVNEAQGCGAITIRIEAPEGRSLPAVLASQLRLGLLKLSRLEIAKDAAVRGLRALAGFVGRMKVTYDDIEAVQDYEPEPGLADNGDLEEDLTMLLDQVGRAARAAEAPVAIFIDELQYVPEPQMAALISALHRCAQLQLPLFLVGAGLPELRGRMAKAKSYAERLFDFPAIGAVDASDDAANAIVAPAQEEGS